MIIQRWKAYEGAGTPDGIRGEDWELDIISGNFIVISETIKLKDNSLEAMTIRKRLKNKTMPSKLTDTKCKECGFLMEKYPLIQHPKANRLGWRFRYICSNDDCLYEYYTKEDS